MSSKSTRQCTGWLLSDGIVEKKHRDLQMKSESLHEGAQVGIQDDKC